MRYVDIVISIIYGLMIDPHNNQQPVGLIAQLADHCTSIAEARGGGVLPYVGHIGMCRCEGYGFQAVYSSIGYINQSFWV